MSGGGSEGQLHAAVSCAEGRRAWMAPSAWPETAQLDFDKQRAVTAEPPGLPQIADAPTEGGPSGAAGRPAILLQKET